MSKEQAGGVGVPVWSDPEGAVAADYGVTAGELTAVVLDPNLRLVGVVLGDQVARRVVALLDGAVHRGPAVEVVRKAPVLLLPRVLDAAYCERLIRLWEQEGPVDTEVARASGDVLDASTSGAATLLSANRACCAVVFGRRAPRAA